MSRVEASWHVFEDAEALARAAALFVVRQLEESVRVHGRATLLLAGGSTPRRLYRVLSEEHAAPQLWERVSLLMGDERLVDAGHKESNRRMIEESLLASEALRRARFLPMPNGGDPDEAADRYEETLRALASEQGQGRAYAWGGRLPRLDLTLLGMGADGHTASLFPGSALLDETRALVRATPDAPRGRRRLSLTLPFLSSSRALLFLVAGADKGPALSAIREGRDPALPAARIEAREELVWMVDRAAAGG